MIKKELTDEIKKHQLRLFGYTLLTCFDKNQQELPLMCAHCQALMFKDFLEFLKKWQLVSESLYSKLSKIIDDAIAEGCADDTYKSENE